MNTYLIAALCILSILLLASLYYNYKFARIILSYQDNIEESLDVLDESYGKLFEILQIPLANDSPQVKAVIGEIEKSRDSILRVAQKIARVEDEKEEI
tara:strand:+ start:117 stop:410 length:294 start_codon:yes stop_codon:yes gene_type:complete